MIGYGAVKAAAPTALRNTRDAATGARAAQVFGFLLAVVPTATPVVVGARNHPRP